MGFFSRIFGRKKKEEENLELREEQPPPIEYPSQPYPGGFHSQQPVMQQPSLESSDREFQVLSSKLDVLNAKLDAINQRLENLERAAEQEQKW